MKNRIYVLIMSLLMSAGLLAQMEDPFQSTSTFTGSGSSYSSQISTVGATDVPYSATTTDVTGTPSGRTIRKIGGGSGMGDGDDPGQAADGSPIGEPLVMLFFAAAAAGVVYFKRKKSTTNMKNTSNFSTLSLLCLMTLGFGFNQEAKALTMNGGTMYYDNSQTNWSGGTDKMQLFVGHNTYTSVYNMTNISNTKLYYYNMSSWSGATYIRFAWANYGSGGFGPSNVPSKSTGTYTGSYTFNSNSLYLFTCSNTAGTLDVEYEDAYTRFNKTQTIKAKVSTNGGSSYSDANTPGKLTGSSKKFSSYNTCGTSSSCTLNAGSSSTTIVTGYTATTTLTAADATGYTFVAWYKGSTQVSTSKSITIYPTDEDTYYAYYKENQYSITATANPAAGGTATPASATVMGQVTGGSITATPKTGYHFVNWTPGTATGTFGSSTTANTTFKPTKTGTVVANFAETLYTITISSGTAASTTAGCVTTGTATAATPAAGKKFDKWQLGTGITLVGCTVNDETISFNASQASTVTATYADASKYDLNVVAGAGITAVSGSKTEQTVLPIVSNIAATPKTGYTFAQWTKSGAGSVNYTSGSATTANATVSISVGSVTLTASATPNTNTPYTVKHYKQNLADDGYTLAETDNLTGTTDASVTPAVKNYTGFTAPSTQTVTIKGDGTTVVTYNYTRNSYTLTWAGLTGATITGGTPAGSVKYGATLIAPTVSKGGYTFTGWTPAVPATMPDNNATYTAQWTEVLYDVTINSSDEEGATLKIEGVDAAWGTTVQVGYETKKDITVTPNPGYKLNAFNVSNGGRVSGSGTAFTVSAAGANGTVTANPVTTPTIFFDNTNAKWSNVYVYLMKEDVWEKTGSGKGAAISGKYYEYNQMTQIGTSKIYYYSYTTASPTQYIAFSSADMHTYDEFYGNNGAYRGDFNECQPMFIPDGTHSQTNTTEYYNSGNWDTYSTTSKYYIVGNDAVFGNWSRSSAPRFTKESATSNIQTVAVTLVANHTYQIKLETCADSWYGVDANTTITSANCTNIQFASDKSENCSINTTVAGTYTFTFDNNTKKLSVEYPSMPAPESITVTAERYYGEDKINTFIATDPYTVYTDELIKLTIDEVAAPTGCTTYYQFGTNEASTERTYTFNNIPVTESSIEAKVFFRPNSGGKDGDATSETINYIGVATPTLHLTASWTEAQEGSDVPENVTIFYSTSDYSGPATVTRSKDGAIAETFFTVPNGTSQKNQTYILPDQNVQRQTFVATANANGRTFSATKAVSIYRLVEITITDENHLMDHYYMWEAGTTPVHEEAAWPGNIFFSTLGNAHIFYVKYPSYTDFVLNNGKAATEDGAAQTINVTVPDQSTCYTIGEKIVSEDEDNGKYQVTTAECPNKLYVGDIANVSAVQGEGVIVSPQVDIDPLLDPNNLTISFDYGSTQGITCDQRGRSFMVTATAGTGTYNISVTYSIPGADPVIKPVTINVTSAIMIQAKYGNLGWADHNEIYIHYWGKGIDATQKMTWKDYVGEAPNKQDRVYARIPLDSEQKINFQIYAWNMDEAWHVTADVNNVTTSGCYTISYNGEDQKRSITRDDDYCWTAYYVEIDMNNGTVYRSNTVEDLTQPVSFFAPKETEPQAKSGLVRIICNGSQKAIVPAATFDSSTVYTAKITEDGTQLTEVAYYTGNYYIRTDGVEGGWDNYIQDSHKFTYFTPYKDALYNYYWVKNIKKDGKLNIKACIGNDINKNLANMIEADNYTDAYGDITPDAGTGVNLRFGYNPRTNHFERSILRGSTAGSSNFLNIVGVNIYDDEDCNKELNETNYSAHPEWSKFGDISDWVYEKNVFVKIDGLHQSAQALLKSKAFNGTTIYQLGYTLDEFGRPTSTPAQHNILNAGTTNGTYNIRIIYDFKTNRIVCAWSPIKDVTFNTSTIIDADVLFVRHENEQAAQVILGTDGAQVSSLQYAYFVMEIDGASDKTSESIYWFSVPFDCEISSIFGVEGYVTLDGNGNPTQGTWGIQTYDGQTRAEKGWYKEDTQTFWRWMDKNERLLKGNGYVLVFDRADAKNKGLWNSITREEPCDDDLDPSCVEGKKTVTTTILRLYFPSMDDKWKMTRSGAGETVIYPDWTCTKPNRKAQDSNWRLMGTNSYSNIMIDAASQFSRLENDSVLDKAPNFVYVYDRSKPAYNRYTATSSVGKHFQSFNCYMVQFSGTINWNQYTQSVPDVNVAARRVAAQNELTNAQMTLSLKKGDATEDNTYIYMDARATINFDNQMDLTKITDTRANQIFSVMDQVEYAGNTLPVEDQIIPLTVNVNANGTYSFNMPEMTQGLEVYLIDNNTNTHTDMAIGSYTVDLNKGKTEGRFYLDVRVKERTTPTIIETIDADGNPTGEQFIKVIQNDQLHIIRNGRIYNASGMKLTK